MSGTQGQEPAPQPAQVADPAPSAPATEPTTNAPAGQTPKVETFDAEYVAKLRKEAADYRTRATAAEAKVKEADDAKLSELELAKKRADEAETRAQERETALRAERLRGTVERTASRLGFANAEIAGKLIDATAITYDDAGQPSNVESLLTDILTANPYLRGAQNAGATTNAARNLNEPEIPKTAQQMRDEIYGGGLGVFDPKRAAARGGGVAELRAPAGRTTG